MWLQEGSRDGADVCQVIHPNDSIAALVVSSDVGEAASLSSLQLHPLLMKRQEHTLTFFFFSPPSLPSCVKLASGGCVCVYSKQFRRSQVHAWQLLASITLVTPDICFGFLYSNSSSSPLLNRKLLLSYYVKGDLRANIEGVGVNVILLLEMKARHDFNRSTFS